MTHSAVDEALNALKVHVVADSTPSKQQPCSGCKNKRYRAEYRTVVLTSGEPVQEILPQADDRFIAYIMPIDNDIVLGKDTGMCGAAVNTASSVPSPSGTYVPAKTTGGALSWLPVHTTDKMYAGATTTASNSRISIIAYYEVKK